MFYGKFYVPFKDNANYTERNINIKTAGNSVIPLTAVYKDGANLHKVHGTLDDATIIVPIFYDVQ